jgi:glycosyltransferase involved in cell wall biosynthesis
LSAQALKFRHDLKLPCVAVLGAYGVMPKAAEAMLFPWQHFLRSGDGLLFTSRADQAIWQKLVIQSDLREWVVPLAVDETVFHPRSQSERSRTRSRYNIPQEALLLLYVGRWNIQKNLHTLLHMAACVSKEIANVHLCLVGEEDDIAFGEFGVRNAGYIAYLCQLAEELGIADRVLFIGPLYGEDLAQAYASADVLINPSFYHRENFGLSQVEAQACGLPVVCTHWGGFKDIVIEGETGYFMDITVTKNGVRVDWAKGVRAIVSLLKEPALRKKMKDKAAKYARKEFSVEALSHRLNGVVVDAVKAPDSSSASAYQLSEFAERYEAHKRACGWYASQGRGNIATRRLPMFQGDDYELYETMIRPYATRLARELKLDDIQADWIPYFGTEVQLDFKQKILLDQDPIWPHQKHASPFEWEILQQVDGISDAGQISKAVKADFSEVAAVLWQYYVEGFLQYQKPQSAYMD